MTGRLIELCARNKVLVLPTLIVAGAGVWSLVNTSLDALPDLWTPRSSSTPSIPARRRRWSRTRSPTR